MKLLQHQQEALEALKNYSSKGIFHPMGSGLR